jgi:hypothetical protein
MFSTFNADSAGNKNAVLEYPVKQGTGNGRWSKNGTEYTFHFLNTQSCIFTLANNTFQLKTGTTCPAMGL